MTESLKREQASVRDDEGQSQAEDNEETVKPEELAAPPDSQLCELQSLESLKTLDGLVHSRLTEDPDILDFMVNNRVSALWKRVIDGHPEFTPDKIRCLGGGKFAVMTRDRFLEQYDGATSLPLPEGYAFARNGKPLLPNLMQRLTAYRLQKEKRIGNWSGVGAGKTIAAILSSGILRSRLTVVVAANATVHEWAKVVGQVFPNAMTHVKSPRSFEPDPDRSSFLILNYESFQQNWSAGVVRRLTEQHRIDYIVLDELQFAKQREESRKSARRDLLEKLLARAAARNPDLCVLGMSATPVVNNLLEGKKLLQLVTGQPFDDLPVGSTVANAVRLHLELKRHGFRYMPRYDLALETQPVLLDSPNSLPHLLQVPSSDVLALEQEMIRIKLRHLPSWLGPKTMIYTQYVEEIVGPLADAVRMAGYRAALFTGEEKTGLRDFIDGKADVLIGSSPVGTGVDGLQHVCNRLIFMSLPWSHAAYEQIVGRLYRQGSVFKKVEVIIPIVVLREAKAGIWSWDDQRKRCIEYKQTLADAAVDGVVPQGGLPSQQEMQRRSLEALREWVTRVEKGIPARGPA